MAMISIDNFDEDAFTLRALNFNEKTLRLSGVKLLCPNSLMQFCERLCGFIHWGRRCISAEFLFEGVLTQWLAVLLFAVYCTTGYALGKFIDQIAAISCVGELRILCPAVTRVHGKTRPSPIYARAGRAV